MAEATDVKGKMISSTRANPSIEHLLAALVSYRHDLVLLEQRAKDDPVKTKRLQLCREKLDEAGAAITKPRPFRKVFFAWDLLHQVGEELILFREPAELAAEGKKLSLDIKLSSLPSAVQTGWVAKLDEVVAKLEKGDISDRDIESARQSVKMGLNTLNSQTDTLFWDIWTKKLASLIYTLSLIAGIAVFGCLYSRPGGFRLCLGNVLLMGALGGVASGIMSADPQYIAKGHFWVSTVYYSLVRPAQGALAALIVFWMMQSQYLIKIDPPLSCSSAAYSCYSCPRPLLQGEKAAVAPKDEAKKDTNTMITLNAAQGKEIYLYLLVLLLAGFSGDKILKAVADKTFSKLFSAAEKTKEADPS